MPALSDTEICTVCGYPSTGRGGVRQDEFGLAPDADAPLVAFMSRLVHQKMPDVLLEALPTLLEEGMQFALVAEGDHCYQEAFKELAIRYPGRMAVRIGYEEPTAHRLV